MSNPFRFLPLTLALLPASLVGQTPITEPAFTRELGAPGAQGSFRAWFARDGAGIVWLQATDHYVTLDAARKSEHATGDNLLLVDSPEHALRLFQAPSAAFPIEPADAEWRADDLADGGLRFTLDGGQGLVLEKVVRHAPEWRGFTVEVTLRNVDSQAVGELTCWLAGPALVNAQQSSVFGDVSVAIAVPTAGDPVTAKATPGELLDLTYGQGPLSFAGTTNRFFGSFLWPLDEASAAAVGRLSLAGMAPRRGQETQDLASLQMRYELRLAVPAKGAATTARIGMFLGPKSYRVFDTLPEPARFAPILEVDLNPPCCGGITIPGGRPMAKLLIWLLGVFHDFLGNWGVAIILLTILVRGAMSPLNFHMQKSMRAYGAKMAKLKPKMDELKVRFADDQRAYQQAMMQFQREHKIIPPLGGCLPIFLTMPIYLGLFTALRTAYDLRQQPFVGWIEDLSTSDALFALPFWPDVFNLLPLLWIGLFVVMQLRMPLPTDPQQRQMQQMMRYMPILFGVMLYNYASALLLYMVTSMLWSLVESSITKKILGPVDPNAAMMTPTPM